MEESIASLRSRNAVIPIDDSVSIEAAADIQSLFDPIPINNS